MANRVRVPELSRIELIDDATAVMFRAMTPAQRIAATSAAHRTARMMVTARLQQLHPDWGPKLVHREVLQRLLGDYWVEKLDAAGIWRSVLARVSTKTDTGEAVDGTS